MRTIILAIAIVLAGNVPASWGQSQPNWTAGPPAPAAAAPRAFADNGVPASGGVGSIVPEAESKSLFAESAEAAEEAAAAKMASRFWVRAEYLLWWFKDANLPPLVTSGPSTDPRPGALDSSNTRILLGGDGFDLQDRYGARLTLGYWLDDEQNWGVQANYFFVGGRTTSQGFSSPGNPVLAVPFYNLGTGLPDAGAVSYPGVESGHVLVGVSSYLQGAELNLTRAIVKTEWLRLEGLVGFRYLNLNEGLSIDQTSDVNLAPQYMGLGIPYNGNTISVSDNFDTRNYFYGGQLGVRAEFSYKRWTLDILTKVALGGSSETVNIHGSTTINTQPVTAYNSGMFALASNSGQFSRNAFSVVPEIGATLGFQLTDHIKVFAGYSFLYWSNVVRPGDQVDTALNPNLIPTSTTFGAAGGPNRPGFAFHNTDFFAHGVNMGLEFRY